MLSDSEILIGLGGVGGRTLQAILCECDERQEDFRQETWVPDKTFEYFYIDKYNELSLYGSPHRSRRRRDWIEGIHFHELNTEHPSAQREQISAQLSLLKHTLSFRLGKEQDVCFRIFCSLGGKTGSGGLIELLTLLHTISRERHCRAHLFVYAFITGKDTGMGWGPFYENEYAVLRDLNALMIGQAPPHSATSEDAAGTEHDSGPVVERVYLSTELAEGHPSLSEQIVAVAKAFVEMMLYRQGRASNGIVDIRRNKQPNRQKKAPTPAPHEEGEQSLYSRRFAALSSRRWYIPKKEIQDYLKASLSHKILGFILHGTPLPEGVRERDIPQLTASSFDIQHSATYAAFREKQEEFAVPLTNVLHAIQRIGKYDVEALEKIHIVSDDIVETISGLAETRSLADFFAPTYQQDLRAFYKNHLKAPLSSPLPEACCPTEIWGLEDILRFLRQNEHIIAEQLNAALAVCHEETEADDAIVSRMRSREQEWKTLGFWTKHFTQKAATMLAAQAEDARKRIQRAGRDLCKVIFTERSRNIAGSLHRLISDLQENISYLTELSYNTARNAEIIQMELEAQGNAFTFFTCPTTTLEPLRKALHEKLTSGLQHPIPDDLLTWFTENDENEENHPIPWRIFDHESVRREPPHDTELWMKILSFTEKISTEACSRICQETPLKEILDTTLLDFLAGRTIYNAAMNFIGGWRCDADIFPHKEISQFVHGICGPISLDNTYALPPHLQDSQLTRLSIGMPREGGTPNFRKDVLAALQDMLHWRFQVPYEQMESYLHDSDDIRVVYTPCDFCAGDADVVKEIADICQRSAHAENGLAAKDCPALVPPADAAKAGKCELP